MKKINYKFHHMGIPTTEVKEGERYSPAFKMYTSDAKDNGFRIQWHRFEKDCPLHPLIQTVPHAAFKVESIDEAIVGKTMLLGPYFPLEGFRVAIINVDGVPIELIETTLTEEEIWESTKKKSLIYPDGN